MIEIVFAGKEADRAKILSEAERLDIVESAEDGVGFEGSEAIRIVLEDGPQVVALLTSIVALVEQLIKTKTAYRLSIDSKPSASSENETTSQK